MSLKAIPAFRTIVVLGIDVVMTAASVALTYLFLHGFEGLSLLGYAQPALLLAVLALTVYPFYGVYRNLWRYVSILDLAVLAQALTFVLGVFYVIWWGFGLPELSPATTFPIIHWMVLFFCLSGPRLLRRTLADPVLARKMWGSRKAGGRSILLVCHPDEAALFIRAQSLSPYDTAFDVVGIVDPTGTALGRAIHGIKVLGAPADLERILRTLKNRPARLGVAQDAFRALPSNFENLCATYGLTLGQLPSPSDLHHREDATLQLKPIAIEDVLGRGQQIIDLSPVAKLLQNEAVMVTGAGGSIGSELVRQIATLQPRQLILLEQSEYGLYGIDRECGEKFPTLNRTSLLGDVRDEQAMNAVFAQYKPAYVFHAAALKHVPIVEAQPYEGVLTNVLGTQVTAQAALKHGSKAFVLISTDKAVAPLSAMGASKRVAEMVTQSLDNEGHKTRFLSVRFGNVLGSSGSVVPLFRHQIAMGGPVTVTHEEMTRFFMTIREAVGLVLQASAEGAVSQERGRVYVLDMGRPVRILDVAHQMIRLAGLEPERDIPIKIVGLRPGEKLHEALFGESETPTPTGISGVLAAKSSADQGDLQTLFQAARAGDGPGVLRALAGLIPDAQINA